MKKNIRSLKFSDFEKIIEKIEEPTYRAKQIYRWLWKKMFIPFKK